MVERDRVALPIVRQCQLLSISRSSFYATPRGEGDTNLAIMAEIDRQFLDTPFYGVRQMTWHLRMKGWPCERQTSPPSDAQDGPDADLSASQDQHASHPDIGPIPTCCVTW